MVHGSTEMVTTKMLRLLFCHPATVFYSKEFLGVPGFTETSFALFDE